MDWKNTTTGSCACGSCYKFGPVKFPYVTYEARYCCFLKKILREYLENLNVEILFISLKEFLSFVVARVSRINLEICAILIKILLESKETFAGNLAVNPQNSRDSSVSSSHNSWE